MNNDLTKLIGAALAVAGVISVGKAFVSRADSASKTGLTLGSGLALVGLGVLLVNNLDDASDKLGDLLA